MSTGFQYSVVLLCYPNVVCFQYSVVLPGYPNLVCGCVVFAVRFICNCGNVLACSIYLFLFAFVIIVAVITIEITTKITIIRTLAIACNYGPVDV